MGGKREGAGRPTKLTPEVVDKILLAIRGGNFRGVAARWAGSSDRALRRVMEEGRKHPSSEAGEIRRRIIEAEEAAEINCVRLVLEAAKRDVKHAEWWLERRRPHRWARQPVQRHEVSGPDGKPIETKTQIDLSKATDEELQILAALAARGGGDADR